ncbi:hypothetical protein Cgig2_021361 [Carnegiea gigantea]|uniref:Uncharacterized protein n=1 Tax=Carnegiea gigantea TaxID=171969 RepID=A0A9Q1QG75_9CARY|nr:hypothetical protein Cgig2_021361 [Carnegiea gigantea]
MRPEREREKKKKKESRIHSCCKKESAERKQKDLPAKKPATLPVSLDLSMSVSRPSPSLARRHCSVAFSWPIHRRTLASVVSSRRHPYWQRSPVLFDCLAHLKLAISAQLSVWFFLTPSHRPLPLAQTFKFRCRLAADSKVSDRLFFPSGASSGTTSLGFKGPSGDDARHHGMVPSLQIHTQTMQRFDCMGRLGDTLL